jgi:hypothetical protein
MDEIHEQKSAQLKKLIDEAEKEYNKLLKDGFEKHDICCKDICVTINKDVSKLNSNIIKAKKIIESTIESKLKKILIANILKEENQLNKLNELKKELYFKGICKCD